MEQQQYGSSAGRPVRGCDRQQCGHSYHQLYGPGAARGNKECNGEPVTRRHHGTGTGMCGIDHYGNRRTAAGVCD